MPDRVLGAVRLSRLTDQSTSPERQTSRIEWWASGNDAEVVATAVDLDVSGAVSPFERDDLGPWLTDARAGEWDILVAWKLDRLSRSARDTLELLEWADARGKRIIAVDDGLDTSTQMGRVWIQLASIFAEVERTNIKERVTASRKHLRQVGRWAGSKAPYGYQTVDRDGGGKCLDLEPTSADVLREVVSRALDRESLVDVARDLNAREVPAPSTGYNRKEGAPETPRWTHGQLRRMLTNPSLRGQATHQGRVIRTPEGDPVTYGPPLVDAETWQLLQRELESRKDVRAPYRATGSTGFLLDVAFCVCGRKMYAQPAARSAKHVSAKNYDSSLYRCSGYRAQYGDRCDLSGGISGPNLERYAEEEFLHRVGRLQIHTRTDHPGTDNRAELAEVESSLKELREDRAAGLYRGERGTAEFRAMYERLESRREALAAQPTSEGRTEWRETGITYAAEWDVANNQRKREMLLECGAEILVGPAKSRGSRDWRGRLTFFMDGPEWLHETGTDDPTLGEH